MSKRLRDIDLNEQRRTVADGRIRAARPNGPRRGTARRLLAASLLVVLLVGCAKYNTYYNAKRAFDDAERVREEALRKNQDPPVPAGKQKQDYERAIQKAQKILDEYPGHSLTDDALFLQAKSWHRLEGYRMSIRKLDLLFQNFPASEYDEEALYLQGLNYLLIGAAQRSQEYLDQLRRRHPDSRYRAEVLKVSGDNAFALERWAEAAEAYQGYLDQEGELQERDRVGLKLAECHWELGNDSEAAAVLQLVGQTAESRELRFRARLLQARVQVRIGDYEVVDLLLRDLASEAEVYQSRAEVRLIRAESLVAQGRSDEAVPLLENMPPEWTANTPTGPAVEARVQDLLGYLYLERGDWERANIAFQAALRRRADLDDPERTRLYSTSLKNYLAAEESLVDAPAERVPEYRLLQANALYFGFDRPALAADLYVAAARDSMAEDTVAARALYGARLVYRERLDRPDSAEIWATELRERYPESPQAYEVEHGAGGDLLGYLLSVRSERQAEAYAALDDSARAALAGEIAPAAVPTALRPGREPELRRRMVYLQRRDPLVFPPTPAERAAAERRREEALAEFRRAAAADSAAAAAAAADTGVVPFPTGADGDPPLGATIPATEAGPTPVAPSVTGADPRTEADGADPDATRDASGTAEGEGQADDAADDAAADDAAGGAADDAAQDGDDRDNGDDEDEGEDDAKEDDEDDFDIW